MNYNKKKTLKVTGESIQGVFIKHQDRNLFTTKEIKHNWNVNFFQDSSLGIQHFSKFVGALNITVIIIENGTDDLTSNPGQYFVLMPLGKAWIHITSYGKIVGLAKLGNWFRRRKTEFKPAVQIDWVTSCSWWRGFDKYILHQVFYEFKHLWIFSFYKVWSCTITFLLIS